MQDFFNVVSKTYCIFFNEIAKRILIFLGNVFNKIIEVVSNTIDSVDIWQQFFIYFSSLVIIYYLFSLLINGFKYKKNKKREYKTAKLKIKQTSKYNNKTRPMIKSIRERTKLFN